MTAATDFVGVHLALQDILTEYFHAFRNDETVVSGLGALHLRYWPYLERSDDAASLFELIAELSLDLLRSSLREEHFSNLLRTTAMWCRRTIDGDRGPLFDDVGARLVGALSDLADAHATSFLDRDSVIHELLLATAPESATGVKAHELYRRVLQLGYQRLRDHLAVADWAVTTEADLTDPSDVAQQFAALSVHALTEQLADITHCADLRHPDIVRFSALLTGALRALASCRFLEDRFAVCLYLLKDDNMGDRQQAALRELLSIVKKLIHPGGDRDIDLILTRLTSFFRDRGDEFPHVRLACYEAVGKAIGLAGDERAANHLIADVLSWRFPYPEVTGATDEWQTVVNPYHLPVIRCWLAIIGSNPALYERLAAALNVQLRSGGVHIADTDVFQRDISRFLGSNIGEIYFVAKQLLRVFPVFFSELGAEGELRAVSTQLDEALLRRDTLLHFFRKQVHAESSNHLVQFSAGILRYWLTLDPEPLRAYVSPATLVTIANERALATGPHEILVRLRDESDDNTDAFVDQLLSMDHQQLAARVAQLTATGPDATRLTKLVRTHQLLRHKYSLTYDNLAAELSRAHHLNAATRDAFIAAQAAWSADPTLRIPLLDAAIELLAELRVVILDREPTEALEQLYHKRHIAAGIPSLYGSYHEPKFDALGLSLRVENLVARLLEDLVNEGADPYLTLDSLRRATATMRRFEKAMAMDGVTSGNLSDYLGMLEASFSKASFSFHQYQNVFAMLARAVSDLSARSVRSHTQVLQQTLVNDLRLLAHKGATADGIAEGVLRDVLVTGLGIQTLDRYVGSILHKMTDLNGVLGPAGLTRMMNFDPERLVWQLHGRTEEPADLPTVGAKGYGLLKMVGDGHRVPEGFILSTELFHVLSVLSYQPFSDDIENRIATALRNLETATGRKLGSGANPLLLSVRSGAPISMPGLMTTFVNVGLNETTTEAMALQPGFDWTAWDSYRRFLQAWAMYDGVDRTVFDGIINDAKARFGVEFKLEFTARQMRQIALSYKSAVQDHSVTLIDDPFQSMMACISKVVRSWDGADPRRYRRYTHIAENWGTAVICQRMIFGNLGRHSGSGVVFTSDPREPYSHQVRLFGDFAVGAQGEDLVGGLVFPLPISESQRQRSATYVGTGHSLEKMFPEIYAGLLEFAETHVKGPNDDPQEIEFTFESPAAEDLYLLQRRAVVQEAQESAPMIDPAADSATQPAAFAMGAAGGAYAGRVAIGPQDVARLSHEYPGEPIILVRPDTVPEDLTLLTQVDGLLTGRGGTTSHAAVTAKRLGKTAVVGCHELTVLEQDSCIVLADTRVAVGGWLTIDGRSGNIYLGQLPLTR